MAPHPGAAAVVYFGVLLVLAALGWTFLLRGWSLGTLANFRIALVTLAILAVVLSGCEVVHAG